MSQPAPDGRFSETPLPSLAPPAQETAFSETPLTQPTPADDPAIPDEAYLHALDGLLKNRRPGEIRDDLVEAGYSDEQIKQIMRRASEYRRQHEAQEAAAVSEPGHGNSGSTNMLIGGAVCLIGLVVTIGTMMASSGGGSYVIAWGAIVFGAVQFFRGMAQSSRGE